MKIKKALIITGLISTLALGSCTINMKDNPTETNQTTTPTTTDNPTTGEETVPTTGTAQVTTDTGVSPTTNTDITPTNTATDPITSTDPVNPTTNTGVTPTTDTTPTTPTTVPTTTTTTTTTPEVVKYNVLLYVDGTRYDEYQVEEGAVLDLPELTKEGYTFYGWYTDSSCQTQYNNSNVTTDVLLYSRFIINNIDNELTLTSYSGYREGAYVKLDLLSGSSKDDYSITYKNLNDTSYKTIDSELKRVNGSELRADILGLPAGSYNIKVTYGSKYTEKLINVGADDRSGYAHFNYSNGIGAYNNDGSIKSNAAIIYVTNATKNTVTYGGKTGLVNILSSSWNVPLDIRILDTIETTQFNEVTYTSTPNTTELVDEQAASLGGNYSGYSADEIISNGWNSYSNDLAKGITTLNGLKSKVSYSSGEFDTAWNNCSISSVSNITVEGVGKDAGLFQWGFTWSKCNSIEVKNLTFTDYTEDACSFQSGGNSDVKNYGNFWVHNCTFNRGKNNWDFTYEQDKHYGDGATDFKNIHNVTSSYNVFNNCKKTGLVGGGDSNYTMNITFHHNFYNTVGSRLPLGRQANMHIYNNYYYNCSTCQDIRANAFVLSEANYFSGCTNCHLVKVTDTYTGTVIKSFNDYVSGGTDQSTIVTTRDEQLSGNCKPDGSTNYTNFDTNSTLFYYDSTNKCSDVSILNNRLDVPEFVELYAGAGNNINIDFEFKEPEPYVEPEIDDDITFTLKESYDFTNSTLTINSLTSDALPTTAGLYQYTNAENFDSNNISLSSNGLYLLDTTASTTYAYLVLNNKINTGVVKYEITFKTPDVQATKWSIVSLLNSDSTGLSLRTDANKYFGYVTDGDAATAIDTSAYQKNTEYTVTFTIDYTNKSAKIEINGNEVVISFDNTIDCVRFMTAGKATDRSFYVKSLKFYIGN